MARDFAVGQSNELMKGGNTYDLHNCYDFGGITIVSARRAWLWFSPNEEHGQGLAPVIIEVDELDFLEITDGVATGRIRDLAEMGYKNPGDRDLDWLVGELQAKDDDHLLFSFGPRDHIRIHGSAMRLRQCASRDDLRKMMSEVY